MIFGWVKFKSGVAIINIKNLISYKIGNRWRANFISFTALKYSNPEIEVLAALLFF